MKCSSWCITLLLLLRGNSLNLVASFSLDSKSFRPANHAKTWLRVSPTVEDNGDAENDDDDEVSKYWEANSQKWEKVLCIFDVQAAYASGSLNGILPSGRESRVASNERLISLPRAIELFQRNEGAIQVRRRYRQMKLSEIRPRWDSAVSKRRALQNSGKWRFAVEESEKYRSFRKSIVEGEVESAEASPMYARAVATIFSPALKAAAAQKKKADGGIEAAQVELLQEAGETAEERWMTAALLAELEEEFLKNFSEMFDPVPSSRSLFAEEEAERDIEDAGSGALLGVLFAVATALLVTLLQELN